MKLSEKIAEVDESRGGIPEDYYEKTMLEYYEIVGAIAGAKLHKNSDFCKIHVRELFEWLCRFVGIGAEDDWALESGIVDKTWEEGWVKEKREDLLPVSSLSNITIHLLGDEDETYSAFSYFVDLAKSLNFKATDFLPVGDANLDRLSKAVASINSLKPVQAISSEELRVDLGEKFVAQTSTSENETPPG